MEGIGDMIVAIIALAIATATDYLYYNEMIWVTSAIPIFIFQLMLLANKKVQSKNDGKGIIKCIIDKIYK